MAFHQILALEGLFCFESTNHRHRWRCIHSRWTTRSGNTQLYRDTEDTNAWMKSTSRPGCSYTAWQKTKKCCCLDLIKQIGKSFLLDNYCMGNYLARMCLGCLASGRHWESAASGHFVLVPIAARGHLWDCGCPWAGCPLDMFYLVGVIEWLSVLHEVRCLVWRGGVTVSQSY